MFAWPQAAHLLQLEALARAEELAPLRRLGVAVARGGEVQPHGGRAEAHELREAAVEDQAEHRRDLPDVHAERVVRDGVLPHEAHVTRELVGRAVVPPAELAVDRQQVLRLGDHAGVVLGAIFLRGDDRLEEELRERVAQQVGAEQVAGVHRVDEPLAHEAGALELLELLLEELKHDLRLLERLREGRARVKDEGGLPHAANVVRERLEAVVVRRGQPLLHCTKVHRFLDMLEVIGQIFRLPIEGLQEQLGSFMLHQLADDFGALPREPLVHGGVDLNGGCHDCTD